LISEGKGVMLEAFALTPKDMSYEFVIWLLYHHHVRYDVTWFSKKARRQAESNLHRQNVFILVSTPGIGRCAM